MFKLGCAARFCTPPPPPPEKQDKPEPAVPTTTSVERSPELILWDRAVEAARQRKHHPDPTQADVLIPWSHGTERTEVQALASTFPSGRATLFLRTSLAPLELALRINKDFFKVLQLTVKVGKRKSDGRLLIDIMVTSAAVVRYGSSSGCINCTVGESSRGTEPAFLERIATYARPQEPAAYIIALHT